MILRARLTYARGDHPLIVIGVDADIVALEVKGKLTVLDVLQLIFV